MVNNKKNKKPSGPLMPFVSVCTPTFNRRPFVPAMIECFNHQDYPKDRMEWIIVDDGTDKIEELVVDIPQVKYFKYDEKMSLGKKRNLMHEKSKGDIIVYMDDDDYYPPQRVSHAVEMLTKNPQALCAGSSRLYIYFKHLDKIWAFGPYGPNHATAGTFAFKRHLLNITKYDDDASIAEEKAFLKNYTIPFVQLDPLKVILVFSHEHNTFDKRKLLDMPHPDYCKPSNLNVDDFVKELKLKNFYMNEIEVLLKTYEPGMPKMKPDVLKQMAEIEERRKKELEKYNQNQNQPFITVQQQGKPPIRLNADQVIDLLRKQTDELAKLQKQIEGNSTFIQLLKTRLNEKDAIIAQLKSENNREKQEENIKMSITEKEDDYVTIDNDDQLLKEINGESE
jgi:glycosyltransferase involved in cell wall biosynthesis